MSVLLLGVLLGLGAAYAIWDDYHDTLARERDILRSHARVVDDNLAQQLRGIDSALRHMRDTAGTLLQARNAVELSNRLGAMSDSMPGVRSMVVLDSQGVVVASSRSELMGIALGSRPYFRTAQMRPDRDTLYLSEPFTTTLNVYSIVLVKARFAPDGQFAGIVIATLDPQYFGVLLRSVLYAEGARSALFDSRGHVFLRMPQMDDAVQLSTRPEQELLARHRLSAQTEDVYILPVQEGGADHMAIVHRMQTGDFRLDEPLVTMISRPMEDVLSSWTRQTMIYAAMVTVTLLSAASVALVARRKEHDLEVMRQSRERAVHDEAQRVQLALDGGDLGLWEVDLVTGMRTVDARALAMVGQGAELARAPIAAWEASMHPDDRAGWTAAKDAYLAGSGDAFTHDYRVRDALGNWIWIHSRGKVVQRDSAGRPTQITGTYLDITATKEAEAKVARSEQLLARMSRVSRTGGWVHDLRTGRSTWTAEMFRIRELDPSSEPSQDDIMQSFSEDSRARLQAARLEAIAHQIPWDLELEMVTAKGHRIWVRSQGEAVVEEGVTTALTGTLRNVTSRKQAQLDLAAANEKLADMAHSDALTGIANRRLFDQTLQVEWTRSARTRLPLALLLVDIDHFKLYNDHYGHAAGDDCLRRVAQTLAARSRRAGDLVCRYGGEEFAILLPATETSNAAVVAQACIDAVLAAGMAHAASLSGPWVTISIGVACQQADAGKTALGLIEAADAALYRAKHAGRGRFEVAGDTHAD